MNDRTDASLEQLSAFADGQLHGDEMAQALAAACGRADMRDAWRSYHLIGDVLRTGRHSPCTDSAVFITGLQRRMAEEGVAIPRAAAQAPVFARRIQAEAANEPVFRWKMVAGVASVAAAAAIGWAWVGTGAGGVPAGAQLAAQEVPAGASASVLAASVPPVPPLAQTRVSVGGESPQIMLRDPRLDELLEAHQQAIGASQMPSGFLRNATFDGAAR